jgi:hypothetical protein
MLGPSAGGEHRPPRARMRRPAEPALSKPGLLAGRNNWPVSPAESTLPRAEERNGGPRPASIGRAARPARRGSWRARRSCCLSRRPDRRIRQEPTCQQVTGDTGYGQPANHERAPEAGFQPPSAEADRRADAAGIACRHRPVHGEPPPVRARSRRVRSTVWIFPAAPAATPFAPLPGSRSARKCAPQALSQGWYTTCPSRGS